MPEKIDAQVGRFLNNELTKKEIFTQIVHEYSERLYWHIRKILLSHEDSHDVLQDTFFKVWKGLEHFKGSSKIYTWLYSISTNEAITFLNKKRRKAAVSFSGHNYELENFLVSSSYFDGNDAELKLQKAILQLPDKQRIVFNMRYFDNIKYANMAKILQTSEGALKASYHHAIKKIEAFLISN